MAFTMAIFSRTCDISLRNTSWSHLIDNSYQLRAFGIPFNFRCYFIGPLPFSPRRARPSGWGWIQGVEGIFLPRHSQLQANHEAIRSGAGNDNAQLVVSCTPKTGCYLVAGSRQAGRAVEEGPAVDPPADRAPDPRARRRRDLHHANLGRRNNVDHSRNIKLWKMMVI